MSARVLGVSLAAFSEESASKPDHDRSWDRQRQEDIVAVKCSASLSNIRLAIIAEKLASKPRGDIPFGKFAENPQYGFGFPRLAKVIWLHLIAPASLAVHLAKGADGRLHFGTRGAAHNIARRDCCQF